MDTASYTPTGFVDSEDSIGVINEGGWSGLSKNKGATNGLCESPQTHN